MQSKFKTEIPPTDRIKHLICSNPQQLSSYLLSETDLAEEKIFELISLGSIYLNKIRIFSDQLLGPGDYLRVHLKPRRYPNIPDLKNRIIFENDDFFIINKPAQIPVHPTVDNYQENLLEELKRQLNIPIFLTHRLDRPTQGLIVYAKNIEFQRRFYRLLAEGKTEKTYEAIVEGKYEQTGLLRHFMFKDDWSPKKVGTEELPGWQECLLEVLASDGKENSKLLIRLITGRTHQIRAQLSAVGHPILNDVLYGAQEFNTDDWIALRAVKLQFMDYSFELTE